jgi:hypothetical protein
MPEIVIAILLVAFLVTNAAWMMHCQRLVNKLMSRDFHTYSATIAQEKLGTKALSAKGPDRPKPESFDHPREDLGVLKSQLMR